MSLGQERLLEGIILKASSSCYTVRTPHGDFVCQARGRLKRTRSQTDLVAVGDRGRVEDRSGTPAIVEVLPRRSRLSRRAPDPHRARTGSTHEQIIVANPDLAVFGFACYDPDPHLRMLDRYLVCAEVEALPAVVVANKIDLSAPGEAREKFGLYERLGYPVHYTCALTGIGVEPLRERLKHGLSVLSGPVRRRQVVTAERDAQRAWPGSEGRQHGNRQRSPHDGDDPNAAIRGRLHCRHARRPRAGTVGCAGRSDRVGLRRVPTLSRPVQVQRLPPRRRAGVRGARGSRAWGGDAQMPSAYSFSPKASVADLHPRFVYGTMLTTLTRAM